LSRVDEAGMPQAVGEATLEAQLNRFERQLIEEALRETAGRASFAAERLAVPKKTLYDKMRRLGISSDEFK
jgi:two-component system C4-dicarboxylate transport response regulator DctD